MDTEKIFKLPYEQFVAKLKDDASKEKVRALILSGREDGNPDDEVVEFKNIDLTARDLTPMQKQLLLESSLKHSLAGKSIATLKDTIDGLPVMINNEPVLTLEGKYIIDGHHRWAEAYVVNPNSRIACIDIQLNMSPFDVLKIIQLSIAGNSGGIPFSKNEGTNLYTISQDEFKKFISWTVSDKVLKIYKKTSDELADYLWNNILSLKKYNKPIVGAPDRIFMPQPSKASGTIKSLANGSVDFKKPFAKMERRIPTLEDFINESKI
jgi:hypothetical protein